MAVLKPGYWGCAIFAQLSISQNMGHRTSPRLSNIASIYFMTETNVVTALYIYKRRVPWTNGSK